MSVTDWSVLYPGALNTKIAEHCPALRYPTPCIHRSLSPQSGLAIMNFNNLQTYADIWL